ncbi:hypothetical protein C8J57DRAFT_1235873 [Mycena rebaudengoi]|nr:hypothetical protein C8J57DRAFT_1235873 [Mycena rebaudengoi]
MDIDEIIRLPTQQIYDMMPMDFDLDALPTQPAPATVPRRSCSLSVGREERALFSEEVGATSQCRPAPRNAARGDVALDVQPRTSVGRQRNSPPRNQHPPELTHFGAGRRHRDTASSRVINAARNAPTQPARKQQHLWTKALRTNSRHCDPRSSRSTKRQMTAPRRVASRLHLLVREERAWEKKGHLCQAQHRRRADETNGTAAVQTRQPRRYAGTKLRGEQSRPAGRALNVSRTGATFAADRTKTTKRRQMGKMERWKDETTKRDEKKNEQKTKGRK